MPDDALSPSSEMLYLVATSGHPNYGDELVAAVWLRFLARVRPEAEVWLDCPNPGLASFLFRDLHPRLRTTDVLWRTVWETTDLDTEAATAHVDRVMTDLGTPRFDLALLEARRATVVHVLGGGYVNAKWPTHVRLLQAALRLRDLSGARLFATGHGLTPASGGRDGAGLPRGVRPCQRPGRRQRRARRCRPGLRRRRAGAARASPATGTAYAVEVAQDDVWVCLQNDMASPAAFDAAVEAVRAALVSPGIAGRPVHYLEALPGVDRFAFDRLSDLIPEENFVPFVALWQGEFPARAGQTWLTSRYHLHLMAAASGAEGTALEIDADFRAQHRSLVEAGTGWSVTPAGSTTSRTPWQHAVLPRPGRPAARGQAGRGPDALPRGGRVEQRPSRSRRRAGSTRATGWRRRA